MKKNSGLIILLIIISSFAPVCGSELLIIPIGEPQETVSGGQQESLFCRKFFDRDSDLGGEGSACALLKFDEGKFFYRLGAKNGGHVNITQIGEWNNASGAPFPEELLAKEIYCLMSPSNDLSDIYNLFIQEVANNRECFKEHLIQLQSSAYHVKEDLRFKAQDCKSDHKNGGLVGGARHINLAVINISSVSGGGELDQAEDDNSGENNDLIDLGKPHVFTVQPNNSTCETSVVDVSINDGRVYPECYSDDKGKAERITNFSTYGFFTVQGSRLKFIHSFNGDEGASIASFFEKKAQVGMYNGDPIYRINSQSNILIGGDYQGKLILATDKAEEVSGSLILDNKNKITVKLLSDIDQVSFNENIVCVRVSDLMCFKSSNVATDQNVQVKLDSNPRVRSSDNENAGQRNFILTKIFSWMHSPKVAVGYLVSGVALYWLLVKTDFGSNFMEKCWLRFNCNN